MIYTTRLGLQAAVPSSNKSDSKTLPSPEPTTNLPQTSLLLLTQVQGHFAITNQAIHELIHEQACSPIASIIESSNVDQRKLGKGRGELHHFLLGSLSLAFHATPSPAWASVYRDVRDIWGLGHWRDAAQKHHFMRRFSPQSSQGAYVEAITWIRSEGTSAANQIRENLTNQANNQETESRNPLLGIASDHLGNALHALQDSFSQSHCLRVDVTPSDPGHIAKLMQYSGFEKQNHAAADRTWKTAHNEFSITGEHAIAASKALLEQVLEMAISEHNSLPKWSSFQAKWLSIDPNLELHREDLIQELVEQSPSLYRMRRRKTNAKQVDAIAKRIMEQFVHDPLNLEELFKKLEYRSKSFASEVAESYLTSFNDGNSIDSIVLQQSHSLCRVLVRLLSHGKPSSKKQDLIDWLQGQ